jgi:hypothetical protein
VGRGAESIGKASRFQSFKVSKATPDADRSLPLEQGTAMDFIWFLAACLLVAFLWFLFLALRVRARKKSVTVEAIGAAMTETKDDPDEPARWVP